jgi:tetratricopeptide (TPR) repeat protein
MSAKEESYLDPTSSVTMSKIKTFAGLKESERALHSAEKTLEDCNDAYAWYQKGALNNFRYEEAVKSFNRAIEIQPGLAIAWYNKGSTLVALGKHE